MEKKDKKHKTPINDIDNNIDKKTEKRLSPVLFIPHGGGPLPLLGDKAHQDMVRFLKEISSALISNNGEPSSILIISAHWEEDVVTMTSGKKPSLIYDYSGFPQSAYDIQYPAPGNPDLAKKIYYLLQDNGIEAKLDETRGFDHGLFVPLKIMFPGANIPCVQISLINSLDAKSHILIGKALSELRKENVLIIGSGFTFHNMKSFFSQKEGESDEKNEAFEKWLVDVCTNDAISESDRTNKLIAWKKAPYSEYCQPREEHLIPLHVCYGLSGTVAKLVFDGKVIGKRTSGFLW